MFRMKLGLPLAAWMGAACLLPSFLGAQSLTDHTCISGPGREIMRDVAVDGSGWSYTAGSRGATPTGALDGLLYAHDANLNVKWFVDLAGAATDELMGVDAFTVSPFVTDVYVTGYFTGSMTLVKHHGFPIHHFTTTMATVTAPGGSTDAAYFVSKFDKDGNHVWTQIAGQAGQANAENGNDVRVVSVGGTRLVYTTGFYRGTTTFTGNVGSFTRTSSGNFNDVFVAKYTDLGTSATLNWVNEVRTSNRHDWGWVLDANSAGDVVAAGSIGGAATAVHAGGSTSMGAISGSDDAFVVQFNAAGTLLRHRVFGGDGSFLSSAADAVRGIAMGNAGEVYLSGHFRGVLNLIPPATSSGSEGFVLRMNAGAGFPTSWVRTFRSAGNDVLYRIALNPSGDKVYLTGAYQGTMVVSGGIGSLAPFNPGSTGQDGFVGRCMSVDGSAAGFLSWIADDPGNENVSGVAVPENTRVLFAGNYDGYFVSEGGMGVLCSNAAFGSWDAVLFEYTVPAVMGSGWGDAREKAALAVDGVPGIYPNPAVGRAHVSLPVGCEGVRVSLYDLSGKLLLSVAVRGDLDLSGLDAGLYVYRIEGCGAPVTGKLVLGSGN